jgi:BirA family transcriptional regulator, biotin operon repressor / biotin---[acetyl-CoA-carboxylase] ligase
VIGEPLVIREEVDSTNTLARTLADEGATHGTAVCAKRQTAGRGRRGRTWLTLPGDHVYLSIILRPQWPVERVPALTLIAAVAVAEALEQLGVPSRIKWPNDVQSRGRKIAGILSELSSDSVGAVQYVVLGVGVNVDTPPDEFPPELRDIATSVVAEATRNTDSQALIASICERLQIWLERCESSLFPVLEAWRARSSTLGQRVRASIEGRELEGTAEAIDETGALLIRSSAGALHRVISGEVITLRPAL